MNSPMPLAQRELLEVSGVLIDFAGTLTTIPNDFDDREPWRAYLRSLGTSAPGTNSPDALARLAEAERASWRDCVDHGRTWTLADILGHASIPDREDARRAYFSCFTVGTTVSRSALRTLRTLAGARIPIVVVSNTLWPREWIVKRLRDGGALPYVRHVGVSSDHSYCKPHPAIFHEGMSRLGVDRPSRAVMVGDRLFEDIAGGARAGLRTLLIGGPHQASAAHIQPTRRLATIGRLPGAIGVRAAWRSSEGG